MMQLSPGAITLFNKEVQRFWKVSFQTVAAPVLTAVLYLLIFGHVLEDHVKVFDKVSYTAFLIPGLVMMSVLQNAFANTSSSLIQSKITGNIIFILLPPLSHWDFFFAYVGGAMVRGLAVGLGVLIATGVVCALERGQRAMDSRVCFARRRDSGRAGSGRGHLGGKV
jgi:ABC-2 type transport system permease protein